MAIDTTKKYREPIAFALLAVAALWFVAGLSLLFKSSEVGFATKSALVGGAFEAPVPVLCLVVAVLLVTRFGDPSPNARAVVLTALGIVGLDLLFGVITFLAQFGSDQGSGFFGIVFAGKAVGALLGLAGLTFLAVAAGYLVTAFQGLPAPAVQPQSQWTGPAYGGYGAQQPPGGQQAWGQPDQGYAQPGAGGWGQPASPYGWVPPTGQGAPGGWPQQPPSGWGQQAPQSQPGWGQQPGYGAPPAPQAQQWSQEAPAGQQPTGWGQPEPTYAESPTTYVESAPDPAWDRAEDDLAPAADDLTPAADEAEDEVAETDVPEPETTPDDDQRSDTPGSDSGWWQHPQR